jgi:hypothetical protein
MWSAATHFPSLPFSEKGCYFRKRKLKPKPMKNTYPKPGDKDSLFSVIIVFLVLYTLAMLKIFGQLAFL